jgi:hypothetical protein
MSNIVQELGTSFLIERFNGCMFFDPQGQVQYINGTGRWPAEMVGTSRISGTPEQPVEERDAVPWDFFKDLRVFNVPPLGWRMNTDGSYLVHFRRNNRSYHRAIANSNLQRTHAPSTNYLINSGNLADRAFRDANSTALMVMRPIYLPFRQGLEQMRAGELLSFAVSATIAVIPEVDDCQTIMFNTTPVAKVLPTGEVVFTSNKNVQPFIEEQL